MTISREPGGRTVLISGASKGIGRSLAERLAEQGDTVVGIARTPDATFPGLLYTADLSDRTATSVALQEISSAHRIDAVVNNVGLVRPQSLEDVTLDALDAVLDVNLRTAIRTSPGRAYWRCAGKGGAASSTSRAWSRSAPLRSAPRMPPLRRP